MGVADTWTDINLARIGMGSDCLIRHIYIEREKIAKGSDRVSATSLLWDIFDFKNKMMGKYHQILDVQDPVQEYALHIFFLHPARMTAMVLSRLNLSVNEKMPGESLLVLLIWQ